MESLLEWTGQLPHWVLISIVVAALLAATAVLCRLIDRITKHGFKLRTKGGAVVIIGPVPEDMGDAENLCGNPEGSPDKAP